VVFFLPIGGLFATDPTFSGNQKQPLKQHTITLNSVSWPLGAKPNVTWQDMGLKRSYRAEGIMTSKKNIGKKTFLDNAFHKKIELSLTNFWGE